ncbi:MAG: pepsin/retropepsin-like aspartic protease family protein, partial [Bacteroidetes bacterium]|nr:pepsin/retropepsin-like aspartic protease family protein [Bacteroidota bacterium]
FRHVSRFSSRVTIFVTCHDFRHASPFFVSCIKFPMALFMNLRPVSFCTTMIGMIMALLSVPVETLATTPPAEKILRIPRRVSICGSPISDRQGNVLGVTIPLKRAGRLLLLEGTIDNLIGNFILDTGASGLVLNKTYFRSTMTFDDEEGGGVTGSTSVVAHMNIKKLMISDLIYTNVFADVIPLGHLENRRGVKILGLFGMSLLKNVEMVFDVSNNELQIYKLDKTGNRLGTPSPVVKYDIMQQTENYRNVMFVKAIIGGKVLDFCLDTGAESNVLSIDAHKAVLATVTITRRSDLSGVGENRGEVLYGTLNDFSMGGRQIKPMETIVCSLAAMSQKYGCSIDGMLGYDFFIKGKIYINLVRKQMGICLNTEGKK